MILGPNILDVNGRPLDQDRDYTAGEIPEDRYTGRFTIDQPPRIVGHTPAGTAIGFITKVEFQFDQPMNTASFSLADDIERLIGPQGAVTPAGFRWINPSTLELRFATHLAEGDELVLRPGILDLAGLALDQDGDENVGEPLDDQYTATFSVNVPPRIVGQNPIGNTIAPIDSLRLVFDQLMDQPPPPPHRPNSSPA